MNAPHGWRGQLRAADLSPVLLSEAKRQFERPLCPAPLPGGVLFWLSSAGRPFWVSRWRVRNAGVAAADAVIGQGASEVSIMPN